MNARMAEATRLTRAGRLEEAMALLRGSIPMRAGMYRALLPLTSSKDRQRRARRLSTWSHHSAERRVRGRQHALRSSLAAQRPTSGRTACAISWSASAAPTFPVLRVVLGRLRSLLCRTARNSRSASTPTKQAAGVTSSTFRAATATSLCRSSSCSTGAPSPPMISLPEHG